MSTLRFPLCLLILSLGLVGFAQAVPHRDNRVLAQSTTSQSTTSQLTTSRSTISQSTTSQSTLSPLATVLSQATILDLSHTYDENTLYWPTSPSNFKIETLASGWTDKGYFYAANAFCTPEHGGTHIDAPIHFGENKQTVEQIPVAKLIGPAVVIDVSAAAAKNRDYQLQLADVRAWEDQYGKIPEDAIILLRTGWSQYWGDRKAYLGDDTPGDASNLHFPSFGAEAVQFLVEERSIAGLGVDTASIDNGPSTDFLVHRIVADANVFGLENLTNLDQLPPIGATLMALPMKIAGGSGAPVRAIAIIPSAD